MARTHGIEELRDDDLDRWSIMAWDSLGQKLIICQLYDHQGNLSAGITRAVRRVRPSQVRRRARDGENQVKTGARA